MTVLKNGNVLTPGGFVSADVLIENGVIAHIGATDRDGVDCRGMSVIPGFVDIHVHGAYGTEFSSPDEEFDTGLINEAKHGVTAVCCTVRCLPLDDVYKAIKNIVKEYKRKPAGAKIEGIHLEGPFVSPVYTGAMDKNCMSLPSPKEVKKLYAASEGLLKIITLAPELEGAAETIKTAKSLGVTVSLGHTGADCATAAKACEAGASRLTHTFNAAVPFHHRSPGVLGFGLTDERMECEAICDFVHLAPEAVKLIYLAKGADKVVMVSDSGVFAGLGDGEFVVAGKQRTVKNGVCVNAEGRIAGSCFTLHEGVKNLLRAGYPIGDVSKMASLNPASSLGIFDKTGTLEPGKDADICVLDADYSVARVFVGGVLYE